MGESVTPTLAFLGVCDRATRVRNVASNLTALNLLGLRQVVVWPFFPQLMRGLSLLFLVNKPIPGSTYRGVLRGAPVLAEIPFKIGTEAAPQGSIPPDPLTYDDVDESGWVPVVWRLEEIAPLILEPGTLEVYELLAEGQEIRIGTIVFAPFTPSPLTADRVAAIRSDPLAMKAVRIQMVCNYCHDGAIVYAGLERSPQREREGWIWYQSVPARFTCGCGRTDFPLSHIGGLHALLGQRRPKSDGDDEQVTATRLYDKGALETVATRFEQLLSSEPEEESVQQFLEENPLLFHPFSPQRIISKAPVINECQTDFAVLSASGELLLVEIEKPTGRLLTKRGDHSADLTHALGQVQNWLNILATHRLAALEGMKLKAEEVNAIRGVVVMGRDRKYPPDQVRRLKSQDLGQVRLFTYDDLLSGLTILIRDFREM